MRPVHSAKGSSHEISARGSGRAVRLGGVTWGLSCALLAGIVTLVRAGDGPPGDSAVPAEQATRTSRFMDRFLAQDVHRRGEQRILPDRRPETGRGRVGAVRRDAGSWIADHVARRRGARPEDDLSLGPDRGAAGCYQRPDPVGHRVLGPPGSRADRVRGDQERACSTENQPCRRPDRDGSDAGRQDADAAAGRRRR